MSRGIGDLSTHKKSIFHSGEQSRDEIEGMLLSAIERDAARLAEHVIRIGAVPQDFDREGLRADIGDFVADYVGQSLKDFDLSGALNALTGIIRRHRILLPARISMLLKVIVMLEGTSRSLNRDFSLAELLQPYYASTVQRRFSPEQLLRKLRRSYRDWDHLIDILPRDLADVLQRVRQGKRGGAA